MMRIHSCSSRHSAFTLVELMVVVFILATLVSLIGSVVMKGMDKNTEYQTRSEIAEMEVALRAFMSDYGLTEPPPSYLVLNETAPFDTTAYEKNGQSAAFLEKLFGKSLGPTDWNGDGVINGGTVLQGNRCLVFYLGGIPNSAAARGGASPAPQGFAANNINPGLSAAQSSKRKGPYFTFVSSRLYYPTQQTSPSWDGFFYYLDPWMAKSGVLSQIGTPYAFFSSAGINNQYAQTTGDNFGAYPYMTGVGQLVNPNTYQIISAGKDGQFGSAVNNLWNPSAGATGTGADDQANFSSTLLGSGQN
jgi:prepilin-type N-terminal cleavage/methylation domain-containing protein